MKSGHRESGSAFTEAGTGPAVVLLHAYPFNRSMWSKQVDFLSVHGHHAVASDLRGLGQNPPVTPLRIEDMAHDLAILMDELKIETATICGSSIGSYVALEFWSQHRNRVRSLVLAGARVTSADEAEKAKRAETAARILAEGLNGSVESISRSLLAEKTIAEKPEVLSQVREMILNTAPEAAAAGQEALANRRDYAGDLLSIDVPALIIAGQEDEVRKPEDADFIQRAIRNSSLEIIKDAGHLMNMEQPEVFNHALRSFLKQSGLEACG